MGQQSGTRCGSAAAARRIGRAFEVLRDGIVGADSCCRSVPHGDIRSSVCGSGRAQRFVHATAVGVGHAVVHGGTNERVPERHRVANRHEAGALGLGCGIRRQTQPAGRLADEHRITRGLGGCDEQPELRIMRNPLHLGEVVRLEPRPTDPGTGAIEEVVS